MLFRLFNTKIKRALGTNPKVLLIIIEVQSLPQHRNLKLLGLPLQTQPSQVLDHSDDLRV